MQFNATGQYARVRFWSFHCSIYFCRKSVDRRGIKVMEFDFRRCSALRPLEKTKVQWQCSRWSIPPRHVTGTWPTSVTRPQNPAYWLAFDNHESSSIQENTKVGTVGQVHNIFIQINIQINIWRNKTLAIMRVNELHDKCKNSWTRCLQYMCYHYKRASRVNVKTQQAIFTFETLQ